MPRSWLNTALAAKEVTCLELDAPLHLLEPVRVTGSRRGAVLVLDLGFRRWEKRGRGDRFLGGKRRSGGGSGDSGIQVKQTANNLAIIMMTMRKSV